MNPRGSMLGTRSSVRATRSLNQSLSECNLFAPTQANGVREREQNEETMPVCEPLHENREQEAF